MVSKPVLIIVNGAPGTGKTTLANKLAIDLALPCLHKDEVKELLYDKLGIGDLKWSQDLGAGVAQMMFAFIDRWIECKRSLIAESAYFFEFARPRIDAVIQNNDIVFLEVYCKTDPRVRSRRFVERAESGTRHEGHTDQQYGGGGDSAKENEEIEARYAPLRVGKVVEVDTTVFGDKEYTELLSHLKKLL